MRASAQALIRLAKRRGFVLLLVGHVTKEGMIAGPRVLEHMVDTVLYFEGERGHQFRILRAVKNRFGPTDEIGVFEMTDGGLREVPNPSALFLAERERRCRRLARSSPASRARRPVLVEIQALVAPTALATPRRAVVGWDSAPAGHDPGGAGGALRHWRSAPATSISTSPAGLRIAEPAADLAVAAALASAALARPLPADTVVFGEIGLAGEVRAVARADARLKEAAKLGFAAAHRAGAAQTRRRPPGAAADGSGACRRPAGAVAPAGRRCARQDADAERRAVHG